MRINPKYLVNLGVLTVGIALGFVSTEFSYFKFDNEINLVDLLTLVISTLVGLYIALSVQRTQTIQKSSKDFLVGEINQIKSEIRGIYNQVIQNQVNFHNTKLNFKAISVSLSALETAFIQCEVKDGEGYIRDSQSKLLLIKQLVTNRSLNGDMIVLSNSDRAAFLNKYYDFNGALTSLIIYVNRI